MENLIEMTKTIMLYLASLLIILYAAREWFYTKRVLMPLLSGFTIVFIFNLEDLISIGLNNKISTADISNILNALLPYIVGIAIAAVLLTIYESQKDKKLINTHIEK